ncbi:hypothetical protein MA16_Dca020320 [Dendrobium catenatum]|uniref:Uncharacterized protein n=1 Tax=Dendrobium catenatum TaxID=906689 RepID=A0A2I0X190_9ASPA|nr:hypothetical protein MA16_Dca020320 [Dendrobium catenatum]
MMVRQRNDIRRLPGRGEGLKWWTDGSTTSDGGPAELKASASRYGGGIDDEDDKVDERVNVFSQIGLVESTMPPLIMLQDKSVIVLIYPFEGHLGYLYVFLAKCLSNLSSTLVVSLYHN